ncbi:response regulator [Micromonospora inositola]|uniref:Two component transcriptional regulator, LuxR family n=1 Tax=Micromonospora inositola TaxID=47865 RepID=A0A1C5H1I2_9ACTN|nr:response regulator transcription factor [Micromonospora inositola]SCG39687.1 two component transcriptional regulator, LuxR family [Micromonospora inositola]
MIRLVLADDQAMVRAGFRMILSAEPDLQVVAEAGDGYEAVSAVARHQPDVVLMDVRMPGLDGVEATRQIIEQTRAGGSTAHVLVLTTFDLDEVVYGALRAGASGFLLKDAPEDRLVTAIRVVADGGSMFAPSITRRLVEQFARHAPGNPSRELARLTDREKQVLVLVARGMTNAEIGATLFVTENTVKTHVARILQKLGLRDRVQAVIAAYESGLVTPHPPG